MRSDRAAAEWILAITACDPRVVRVIGYAVLALSAVVQPIRRVVVQPAEFAGADRRTFMPVTAANQKQVYPAPASVLNFQVIRQRPVSFRHGRRCVAEFARPLTQEQVAVISDICDCWTRVAFGAYPVEQEDLATGNGAIFNASTQQFDDLSMEIVVDDFGGSEAAWAPLLNTMGWIHGQLASIQSITIR
jgi:hypothetical protein